MSFSDSDNERDETAYEAALAADEPTPTPTPCPDLSQPSTALTAVEGDNGTLGHLALPDDWVSYRVTCNDRDTVFDLFQDCCCVIAEEYSRLGVQHYHVVVAGHAMYETVRKRLKRASFTRAMYWSQKNRGTFLKAISYTVKCGEYWTRNGFNQWVIHAPDWVFAASTGVTQTNMTQFIDQQDKKDIVLNYNNVVYHAVREARKFQHTADWSFAEALRHYMDRTGVTLSYNLAIHGLPDFYQDEYRTRLGHQPRDMSWMKYRF